MLRVTNGVVVHQFAYHSLNEVKIEGGVGPVAGAGLPEDIFLSDGGRGGREGRWE